ncbi:MAG: Ig-like domain-containing protein, partial [Acidimicrobiia bacterium]
MLRNETGLRKAIALPVAFAMLLAAFVAVSSQSADAANPGGNGFIVFEDGFNLYAMPSDGTGAPVDITPALSPYTDPALSPDGSQIAFSRDVAGSAAVWIADFNGTSAISGEVQVTAGPTDGAPTWSPNGDMLAFSRRAVVTGSATADDATGVVLTDDTADFVDTDGVIAGMPVRNSRTGASGTVASATGTTITLAAALTGGDPDNEWKTTDGYTVKTRRQIFSAATNLTNQVGTLLSAAGSSADYDDLRPVWSPLGTKIAFETSRPSGGASDIFIMNTNGTTPELVTSGSTFDSASRRPAWSPDGLRLAFDANEGAAGTGSNIWTVDGVAGGGNETNVTGGATGVDDDTDAAFSPDGEKIAFVRAGGRTWEIATDGSSGLAVVNGSGPTSHNQPDWQPAVVGADDAYVVGEGDSISPSAPGVLANDGLIPSLGTATAVNASTPANGTLTFNTDGSFTYEHDGSETLSDSFTYQPKQGATTGVAATVNITVTPEDDAPIANDDGPYNVDFGGATNVAAPGVLGNDVDEGAMTAVNASTPTHGTVVLALDGSFTYTHNGATGSADSFTYQAKDAGGQLSNTATVSITIGGNLAAVHSTGLVDPISGLWYLYDSSGALETSFYFGNPGDYPFMGDWDGDGVETPGLYRQSDGYVYLRNSNTQGEADIRFFFGNPGDVPIAGDFN